MKCFLALLAITLVRLSTSSQILRCIQCLENSKIFSRNVYYPISKYEFSCVNNTQEIPRENVILRYACKLPECFCIQKPAKKIINRSVLCSPFDKSDSCLWNIDDFVLSENDPIKPPHNGKTGKAVLPAALNLLIFPFLSIYHE